MINKKILGIVAFIPQRPINSTGNNRVLNKRYKFGNRCRKQNKYLIKCLKLKVVWIKVEKSFFSALVYVVTNIFVFYFLRNKNCIPDECKS